MKARIVFNDQEYLIHLKKEDYSIEFLSNFIRRIQQEDAAFRAEQEGDIKTRVLEYPDGLRYDRLEDK